jgi:hypothetical protein
MAPRIIRANAFQERLDTFRGLDCVYGRTLPYEVGASGQSYLKNMDNPLCRWQGDGMATTLILLMYMFVNFPDMSVICATAATND